MKHPKLRKEFFLAIVFSSIYLLFSIFHYHLDKYLQGIRIDIIRIVLFIILLALFAVQLFKIYTRRKKSRGRIKLKLVFYIPAIILILTMLYTISPLKLDSEKLESPITLRGCYEGGNSHAFIKFRENKHFEIKWNTESDFDEWFTGTYTQQKDTLFLTYYEKVTDKFGSVVLTSPTMIRSLDKSQSVKNEYVSFYVGNCKGN